jgi:hypothetical protein
MAYSYMFLISAILDGLFCFIELFVQHASFLNFKSKMLILRKIKKLWERNYEKVNFPLLEDLVISCLRESGRKYTHSKVSKKKAA